MRIHKTSGLDSTWNHLDGFSYFKRQEGSKRGSEAGAVFPVGPFLAPTARYVWAGGWWWITDLSWTSWIQGNPSRRQQTSSRAFRVGRKQLSTLQRSFLLFPHNYSASHPPPPYMSFCVMDIAMVMDHHHHNEASSSPVML